MDQSSERQMLTEKQKRDFCAHLLQVYGIQIDINNELLPMYYLSYSSSSLAERSIRKATEALISSVNEFEKNTDSKLDKIQSKQFHFGSNWQAFWFGFGSIGLPATLAVIGALIAYMLWFNRTEAAQNAKDIQAFLSEHKQIASFQDLSDYQPVQDMKIGDKTLQYIQMPVVQTIQQALPGRNVVVEFKKDESGKIQNASIKIPLRLVNN